MKLYIAGRILPATSSRIYTKTIFIVLGTILCGIFNLLNGKRECLLQIRRGNLRNTHKQKYHQNFKK